MTNRRGWDPPLINVHQSARGKQLYERLRDALVCSLYRCTLSDRLRFHTRNGALTNGFYSPVYLVSLSSLERERERRKGVCRRSFDKFRAMSNESLRLRARRSSRENTRKGWRAVGDVRFRSRDTTQVASSLCKPSGSVQPRENYRRSRRLLYSILLRSNSSNSRSRITINRGR